MASGLCREAATETSGPVLSSAPPTGKEGGCSTKDGPFRRANSASRSSSASFSASLRRLSDEYSGSSFWPSATSSRALFPSVGSFDSASLVAHSGPAITVHSPSPPLRPEPMPRTISPATPSRKCAYSRGAAPASSVKR